MAVEAVIEVVILAVKQIHQGKKEKIVIPRKNEIDEPWFEMTDIFSFFEKVKSSDQAVENWTD